MPDRYDLWWGMYCHALLVPRAPRLARFRLLTGVGRRVRPSSPSVSRRVRREYNILRGRLRLWLLSSLP